MAQGHNLQVDIVYGVDYQVSNPACSHAFRIWARQYSSRGRLRHWYSFFRFYAFFTATPEILPLYSTLVHQFQMQFRGWARAFTSDLMNHLHALYAQ